jgi:methyl-accepting chemotaxis protein
MAWLLHSFDNLKVGTKVAVGFAAVLAILCILAISSYWTLTALRGAFETYAQRVQVVGIARDVDREFLELRRFVREFAAGGQESQVESANRIRPVLAAAITRGLTEIRNPDRLAKIKEINAEYEKYCAHFDQLIGLRREQTAHLSDVLDPTGLKLSREIEEIQAASGKANNTDALILSGAAMEQLMLVRLNVNKLLARHDDALRDAADKAFADLQTAMAGLGKAIDTPELRTLFDQVSNNANIYRDAYVKAAEDVHEIDSLVNGEMRASAEDIAARALDIKTSGIAEEHAIEQETLVLIGHSEMLMLVLSVCGVIIGCALAWLIGRSIAQPIRAIAAVLLDLAGGNMAVQVPYADRADEVGENARAAQIFKENLIRIAKMEADQSAAARAAQERADALKRHMDKFWNTIGGVIGTVASASTQLEGAAISLNKTADTTRMLSGTVAAASEQTSSNVQGVAAASEQLASTVSEIARQVQESSTIAGQAVRQASTTNDRVHDLSQSAERIGDVVNLINSIAGQTNLLALNATIEAARAGDAGKGFAVVAQEVKALAAQTAKATHEIASHIAGMQQATQDAVTAIKEISATINRMSEISGHIAAAVEQQGTTTSEISRNVIEAAKGTSEVATSITDVSRGASETGSASSQVLSSARELSSESLRLRREVETFLADVKAA